MEDGRIDIALRLTKVFRRLAAGGVDLNSDIGAERAGMAVVDVLWPIPRIGVVRESRTEAERKLISEAQRTLKTLNTCSKGWRLALDRARRAMQALVDRGLEIPAELVSALTSPEVEAPVVLMGALCEVLEACASCNAPRQVWQERGDVVCVACGGEIRPGGTNGEGITKAVEEAHQALQAQDGGELGRG